MTTLTTNETIALNMIARNLYQPNNGGRPATFADTSAVWSNCLDSHSAPEELTGRTLSATCASLAKKGLVTTYDDPRTARERRGSPNESTIELTEAGFAAWLAAFPPEPAPAAAEPVVEPVAEPVVEPVAEPVPTAAEALAALAVTVERIDEAPEAPAAVPPSAARVARVEFAVYRVDATGARFRRRTYPTFEAADVEAHDAAPRLAAGDRLVVVRFVTLAEDLATYA